MDEKILDIKIITPMLSHGIDKAEIRIPEFKAAMRFWWRVLGDFNNLKEMRVKEGKIFGDSLDAEKDNEKREYYASPISISKIVESNLCIQNKKVGYRKDKNQIWKKLMIDGINNDQKFKMIICKKINKGKELEYYVNLLELVSVLGGIGERSRRGYGCFYIEKIDGKSEIDIKKREDIFKYICSKMENLKFDGNYEFCRDKFNIKRKMEPNEDKQGSKLKYPFLEEVYIGSECSKNEFFDRIKNAIDKARERNITYMKESSNKRFASPVYVTCFSSDVKQVYPILCFLNNTSYSGEENEEYKEIFRSEIVC